MIGGDRTLATLIKKLQTNLQNTVFGFVRFSLRHYVPTICYIINKIHQKKLRNLTFRVFALKIKPNSALFVVSSYELPIKTNRYNSTV